MYKISIPIINDTFDERYLEEVKKAGASRVLLVPRGDREDLEDAKKRAERLKRNADMLRDAGIEPAIWVGNTIGHGSPLEGVKTLPTKAEYQPLVNLAGDVLPDTYCPFDEKFRKMEARYVATLAKHSTIKLIFLDDDYRLSQHGKEFCCACELHMARIRELCGEDISREELKKLAFESKANKYREAWLAAERESLELLARDIREAVDEVDEDVCVSLCAAHSIWGVDGTSATDISKILAGKNKPVTRLHPAPYWATQSTMPLPTVFEIARMFAHFAKDSGSELVAEGDVYPRPRYNIPSSHLELFDAVMRADGTYDGTLKYMIDYCSPFEHERGYVKRHIRNLDLMNEISEMFDGKECVGVYTPADRKVMNYADFELGNAFRNNYPLPTAARAMAHLSIPSSYTGGSCAAVFGENARVCELSVIEKGAMLDAISAKILSDRGVDVGIRSGVELIPSRPSMVLDERGSYLINSKCSEGRFMRCELDESCEVLVSADIKEWGRVPLVYRYENADGQRFLVTTADTMGLPNISGVLKGYHMQRIYTEAYEWISGEKLPASSEKNPDLYLLCKKSEDGKKMAVGLFNCHADSVLDPVVVLDREYRKIRFVGNMQGNIEGNKVYLDCDLPAFEFTAFEVEI